MSFSHMILLALVALIVIPPEKLPEFARQVARIFNELRRSTTGIWDDLKRDAMVKPEDLVHYKPSPPPATPPTPTAPPTATMTPPDSEKKPHE
ncbi:MAG: twin-arginine translocase TatA/TatE family subunit [Bdellovibrionaceae bacterium]|nr:twin-arginine translocase TatA/TatE family subunit [Bdellovibrio sp.]